MPFINNYSIECVGQAGRMDGLSAKLRHQTKPGPGLHLSEPRDIGQTFNKDFILKMLLLHYFLNKFYLFYINFLILIMKTSNCQWIGSWQMSKNLNSSYFTCSVNCITSHHANTHSGPFLWQKRYSNVIGFKPNTKSFWQIHVQNIGWSR